MRFAIKFSKPSVLVLGCVLGTFVASCSKPGAGDGGVVDNKPSTKCDASGAQCIRGVEVCVAGLCEAIDCSDTHKCDPLTQYCVAGRQCIQRSCSGVSCSSTQECVKGICTEKKCTQSATTGTEPLTCAGEGQYCETLTNKCADSNCNSSVVCAGGLFCSNGRCLGCTTDSNCATGQACIAGICQRKVALGEACEKSTDCLDATMECAAAPRSVCVKKVGENCQEDQDCLYSCASFKCLAQNRSTGSPCSADTQCPTDHVCSPASDPKMSGQLVCLKNEGQLCVDGKECLSYNCNGRCQPCVAGLDCTFGKEICRTYKTTCSYGRTLCEGSGVVSPDYASCTDPKNALVDTCFNGACTMKLYKKRILSGTTNYNLGTEANAEPTVKPAIDAKIPIYAELSLEAGARIFASNTGGTAMTFSGLPKDSVVKFVNKGQVWGSGGNGGHGAGLEKNDVVSHYATPGTPGGHAIYTEYYLLLDNTGGDLRGGGGGGGGGGAIYQWINCAGEHSTQGIGGGGGGGAGTISGLGGPGEDTPSTWFGVSKPGANGTDVSAGAGGDPFNSEKFGSGSCKMYSWGGRGGNGGEWGEDGQDGAYASDSQSWGIHTVQSIPPAKGGGKGYAVYRANGAAVVFIPGKDASGAEVTGKGIVKGSTELPPP